ncbi:MAG: 50S ribosomal protein L10 [Myxococcota bacterium]|nr:50S ribosomal protein L10 [Myxococcota bacterium]
MLNRAQKEEVVADLKDKFGRAKMVCVADYRGLDVDQVNALRSKIRGEGQGDFEYAVVKNTLLRRAAEGLEVDVIRDHFKGPTAIAVSYGDPVGLAKVLVDYEKENEAFELRGACLDGKAMDKAELATLATLPSLDELRGKLVGLLQAPAQKIAAVLAAPGTQVARVVDARRAQLEESGGA